MPRNSRILQTVLIAGLLIPVGFIACGRSTVGPTPAVDESRDSRIESPQVESPATIGPAIAVSDDATTERSTVATDSPVRIYRPDDKRTRHDDARLAAAGVHAFESRHLKLYTDLDREVARTLPPLIDEAYESWVDYFGLLPEDRESQDFQMTGYLIRDVALFRQLALMPEEFTFDHGSHRRNEFWMFDQEFDYYRRHLLIHEATHCFMTFVPGVDAPRWYLEGMAEFFGTHGVNPGIPTLFHTMPTSPDEFAGLGRISIIRSEVAKDNSLSIPSILSIDPAKFVTPIPYAWSWALCAFLDGTPRYRERFRQLGGFTRQNQFSRAFAELFDPDRRDLATEWMLFVANIQYGYDLKRAAIDFAQGTALSEENPEMIVKIAADRGWQSTRVMLTEGVEYEVKARGRFQLTDGDRDSKAWISEPQGISFRYFDGVPLGMLLGCLHSETGASEGADDQMLKIIAIGSDRTLQAPVTGTLYLRLNDAWNSLHDNSGEAIVTIRERK